MIKTLLLATSCVIGSGAGALQKNAPAFTKQYQITGSNTTDQITLNLDSNPPKNIYMDGIALQAGKTTDNLTYKNYITARNTTAVKNKYEQDPQDYADQITTNYKITKITPYLNMAYMDISGTMNNPIYIGTGPDTYAEFKFGVYITKNTKCEQIINQYDFASRNYNPLNIFTNEELEEMKKCQYSCSIENNIQTNEQTYGDVVAYMDTFNDIGGPYIEIEGEYDATWTINNSLDSFYIIEYCIYYIESVENGNFLNYNSTIELFTTLEFSLNGSVEPTDATNYEVVDVGGLMFDILTMPFTFISRAFSLTLFPNTPYSVNIAQLFLAIFAGLVFIFIIRKFINK